MKYELEKNCYLFHSFVGDYPVEFMRLVRHKLNRNIDSEKFMTFYNGGNSVGELEKSLGLDVREVMCCASKISPAVIYHRPYGLILSGEVKVMFDNDSGVVMLPDGTYDSEPHFDFTHKADLQTLMTKWYDEFKKSPVFTWNEVILKRNSKIIGAFHDPSFNPESLMFAYLCTFKEQEYAKFLEKVKKLGLGLLEINAKFKL
ncbi:hypothetical protein HYT92_00520 [Candidatus Pacearchaeota archaeon]|nr:hypothetical protein [Candidatus Pacearchaeota archaeon]